MGRTFVALTLALLLGACAKPNPKLTSAEKSPERQEQEEKKEEKVDPVEEKDPTATLLEGKWETRCIDDYDYSLQVPEISFVYVATFSGDSFLLEDEVYGGHGCDPDEFIAVENTASYNVRIEPIQDSVMTHRIHRSDGGSYVIRKDAQSYLTAFESFLQSRNTSDYGFRYYKVDQTLATR